MATSEISIYDNWDQKKRPGANFKLGRSDSRLSASGGNKQKIIKKASTDSPRYKAGADKAGFSGEAGFSSNTVL